MKKNVAALLAVVLTVALLAGCGKRTDAVKQLEAKIESVGVVGYESGELLAGLRAEYDALSDKEKAGVKKKILTILEEKETQFASLSEITAYLRALDDTSRSGSGLQKNAYADLQGRADEIRAKYDALPEEVRSQIEGFDLTRFEEQISEVQTSVDEAPAEAVEYVKAFYNCNRDGNYTVSGVYCIKMAFPQYSQYPEQHYYALTYEDAAGETHAVYAGGIVPAGVTAKTFESKPELFFGEAPPSDKYDPVTNGNVTLDVAAILAAAQK